MANALSTTVKNAAYQRRLPDTLARLLADPLMPGEAWQLPDPLPMHGELMAGIEILTVPQVEEGHAGYCLGKLSMAFEAGVKLSKDEASLRKAVWLEANADLGNELWTEATKAAIQTLKWMPKPAEFRALVADRLDRRNTQLRRLRQMLEKAAVPASPAKRGISNAVKLEGARQARAYYARLGHVGHVENLDRQIAMLEGRDPPSIVDQEGWTNRARDATESSTSGSFRKIELPPAVEAARLRNQAKSFRLQGHTAMAEHLEAQARKYDPPEVYDGQDRLADG